MEATSDGPNLTTLKERLRGPLFLPGDADYDAARALWNGRFDPRPLAIARCSGTADVISSVRFARDHDVPISIKSTGHSYAGDSVRDGALVLDLSRMNAVRVDPDAKTARVGPGARWGDVDHETQVFGLATTGGTVSTVGVAGYTLGGGTGYLARKYGLGLDNLLSADVVTADGQRVHVSEKQHPDLFWGIRGGGAHLGVVTDFEFQLHEVGPQILAGQIVYPFEQASDVLRFWRATMAEAPNELQCYPFILRIPPIDAFPPEVHGKVAIDLVVAYTGTLSDGEHHVEPLRTCGEPILNAVEPTSYAAAQQTFDAGMPAGLRWYSRAHFFDDISDDAIEMIVARCEELPGPFTVVYFEPLGGAIGDVDAAATAYPHRDATFGFHIFPGWSNAEDDARIMEWARSFSDDVAPFTSNGVYVNLLGDDEQGRLGEAYGENYDRLVRLKQRYDPNNMFSSKYDVLPELEG